MDGWVQLGLLPRRPQFISSACEVSVDEGQKQHPRKYVDEMQTLQETQDQFKPSLRSGQCRLKIVTQRKPKLQSEPRSLQVSSHETTRES